MSDPVEIPVLGYHRILVNDREDREKHSVPLRDFERQVAYLRECGFMSVDLSELLMPDGSRFQLDQKRKAIVITFDDGHDSDYRHAFPVLQKYGFVGVSFIIVGWVGNAGYLSWEQIIEMSHFGVSIQSHTMTHRFLPDLSGEDLREELRVSKAMLEEKLGKSVDFLSIPNGFANKRVIDAVISEGYKGVCRSVPGLSRFEQKEFRILDRLMITRKTSFDTFCRIVNGDGELVRFLRAEYQIKSAIRKLIGNKLYYKLWAAISKEV